MRDVLRLWVATKMLNLPASIRGDAKFGTRVQDPTSPFRGIVPAAPVMCAQLEIIVSSQVQHPCRESVMKKLEKMFQKPDLRHWFTIYLTLFILLHISSLTASREAERAKILNETVRILRQRQEPNVYFTLTNPQKRSADPERITINHKSLGAMTFCYRAYKDNIQPWRLVEDPNQVSKLTKAGLTQEQIDLLRNTRKWVAQKREPREGSRQTRALTMSRCSHVAGAIDGRPYGPLLLHIAALRRALEALTSHPKAWTPRGGLAWYAVDKASAMPNFVSSQGLSLLKSGQP